MLILHLSLECYPIAKVGGLGDVVGALPKYLNRNDSESWVVMPKYRRKWFDNHQTEIVYRNKVKLDCSQVPFQIERLSESVLGFPVYFIDIPGLWDRPGVYSDSSTNDEYWDTFERYISFQKAALMWISDFDQKPDILHCHDHHTGLIPFMTMCADDFESLKRIPTVLTIHNGEYHGRYSFSEVKFLPKFGWNNVGLLDWHGEMNALAAGIKTAWRVTTVSESYMQELQYHSNGLEALLNKEEGKCIGIVNGIDTEQWNPETDELLEDHYSVDTADKGKKSNKKHLCSKFGLDPKKPLFSFIGRMVNEKGADLLPDLIIKSVDRYPDVQFLILGTGERKLEHRLAEVGADFRENVHVELAYDEKLAHKMYAGSDFMIMPSRVEPCGLNQMYALRYGTIPIVRAVGGLKDTVIDVDEDKNGYGIKFYDFNIPESFEAIEKALRLFNDKKRLKTVIKRGMSLDFSWNSSALNYISLYKTLVKESEKL